MVLIYSTEHGAWWRPDSCGYTLSRYEAGVYRRDEAEKIAAGSQGKNERIKEMTPADHLHRAAPELLGALSRAAGMLADVAGDLEDGGSFDGLRGKYVTALLSARDDARDAIKKALGAE